MKRVIARDSFSARESLADTKSCWDLCIDAILNDRANEISALLKKNVQVFNYYDNEGCNILHRIAASEQKVSSELIREVIITSVLINQSKCDILDNLFFNVNKDGYGPLQVALKSGQSHRIPLMVEIYSIALRVGCGLKDATVKEKLSNLITLPNPKGVSLLSLAEILHNQPIISFLSMHIDTNYNSSVRITKIPSQQSESSAVTRESSTEDIISVRKSSHSERVKESSLKQPFSDGTNTKRSSQGCMIN